MGGHDDRSRWNSPCTTRGRQVRLARGGRAPRVNAKAGGVRLGGLRTGLVNILRRRTAEDLREHGITYAKVRAAQTCQRLGEIQALNAAIGGRAQEPSVPITGHPRRRASRPVALIDQHNGGMERCRQDKRVPLSRPTLARASVWSGPVAARRRQRRTELCTLTSSSSRPR